MVHTQKEGAQRSVPRARLLARSSLDSASMAEDEDDELLLLLLLLLLLDEAAAAGSSPVRSIGTTAASSWLVFASESWWRRIMCVLTAHLCALGS